MLSSGNGKQNSADFHCECDGTGYTGALCHTSLNHRSCMDVSLRNPSIRSEFLCICNISFPFVYSGKVGVHRVLGAILTPKISRVRETLVFGLNWVLLITPYEEFCPIPLPPTIIFSLYIEF